MSIEEEASSNLENSESESLCVKELYSYCISGNYGKIYKIFENNDFSLKTIDKALRLCIRNNKRDYSNYRDSIDLLLSYANINYKNPQVWNSTILMQAFHLGDFEVCKQLLLYDYSNSSMTTAKKIEVNGIDDKNRNCLHYLIHPKNNEEEILSILELLFQYSEIHFKCDINEFIIESIRSNKTLIEDLNIDEDGRIICNNNPPYSFNLNEGLNKQDVTGNTPLSLALKSGFYLLSKKLIGIGADCKHTIHSTGNSMIFCAIEGKNLNCLYLILKYMDQNKVLQTNKDNITASQLAKNLKLSYFASIIDNFQQNFNNCLFKSLIKNKEFITQYDILAKYNKKKFKEAHFLMNQLKLNQSIVTVDTTIIDWNLILTDYQIELNRFDGTFKEEHILSKFQSAQSSQKNHLNEIFSFLFNLKNRKQEEFQNINILLLNKGFVYLKFSKYNECLYTYVEILQKIDDEYDESVRWILYYHISFVFVEILINLGYFDLVNLILNTLKRNLFTSFIDKKDQKYCAEYAYISDYLNESQFLNKFSVTWDESFSLLNIYLCYNNFYLKKLPESEKNINEFERLYNHCKYKEDAKIFDNYRIFAYFLKIRIYDSNKKYHKCIKKLNKINNLLNECEYNLTVNDQIFKSDSYPIKYYYCLFNSLGIYSLKQEDYQLSEFYFLKAIQFFKTAVNKINNNSYPFDIRYEDYYSIKYNLGICKLMQKKYSEALPIFESIRSKLPTKAIFIHYRIAICLKEICFSELAMLAKKHHSDLIHTTIGYNQDDNSNELKRIVIQNINKHRETQRRIKEKLLQAINNYKEVVSLYYSKSSFIIHNENLNFIHSFYDLDKEFNSSKINQQYVSQNYEKLFYNSYINLIFLLIINHDYSEALMYCQRMDIIKNFDKPNKLRIENYRVECLLRLNKNEEALEFLEESINSCTKIDIKSDFYNCFDNKHTTQISFKTAFQINLAKVYFKQNRLKEARTVINNLISIYTMNKEEIPSFVSNLTLYYYLLQGKYNIVFSILKKNKIELINESDSL